MNRDRFLALLKKYKHLLIFGFLALAIFTLTLSTLLDIIGRWTRSHEEENAICLTEQSLRPTLGTLELDLTFITDPLVQRPCSPLVQEKVSKALAADPCIEFDKWAPFWQNEGIAQCNPNLTKLKAITYHVILTVRIQYPDDERNLRDKLSYGKEEITTALRQKLSSLPPNLFTVPMECAESLITRTKQLFGYREDLYPFPPSLTKVETTETPQWNLSYRSCAIEGPKTNTCSVSTKQEYMAYLVLDQLNQYLMLNSFTIEHNEEPIVTGFVEKGICILKMHEYQISETSIKSG